MGNKQIIGCLASIIISIATIATAEAQGLLPSDSDSNYVCGAQGAEIARQNMARMVLIQSIGPAVQPEPGAEGEEPQQRGRQVGTGSGLVLPGGQYILTNHHVVSMEDTDYADVTYVGVFNSGIPVELKYVSSDAAMDLAILEVNPADVPSSFPHHLGLEYRDSSDLNILEQVYALGNPLGLFFTAVELEIASEFPYMLGGITTLPDGSQAQIPSRGFLMSDGLNPGNSGGPIFDCQGRFAGVAVAIHGVGAGGPALSIGIPAELAEKAVPYLIKGQPLPRAGFGGMMLNQQAQVMMVLPESPAQGAGLMAGDLVHAINGRITLHNSGYVAMYLSEVFVGETVEVEVLRRGFAAPIKLQIQM